MTHSTFERVPPALRRLSAVCAVLACFAASTVQAADGGPRHHAEGAFDAAAGTYEVVKGDDLNAVAERFGVTVTELKEANNLESDTISIGQSLVVKSETVKEAAGSGAQASGASEAHVVHPKSNGGSSLALAEHKIRDAVDVALYCIGDVKRLCSDQIIGGEGLKACMKDNITQLSSPCFEALMTVVTAGMTPPPDYAATAQEMRFDSVRGFQYCELNFIYADLQNATLYTEMWNSTGLNNQVDPKNTCPADVWARVDSAALAKQHDVIGVWKNGPRGWTMDWFELPVGEVTTFDGWQGRWMARPTLPKGVNPHVKGSSAYKPLIVDRKSTMTFDKGKPVFILDGPDGTPWVMQAFAKIVDPTLTYDGLYDLGSKLKPAAGWSYRVKVLDEDLTIRAVGGKAHLVQDELENSYDGCVDDACTYKP